MERIEAVEAIKIELEDIVFENYYDEKGSEWCANLILTRIEELGMLPPERVFTKKLKGQTLTMKEISYTWEK